jgi:hypothetical protein
MNVSPDADRHGRTFGLTWPQALHSWGRPELRLLFWAARHMAWVSAPLRERITVVRGLYWALLTDVPDGEGGRQKLPRPVLLFDAFFDVDLRRYIELFSETLRWRFRALWGSGTGYPGVLPADGFLAWVDENRAPPAHFWCAYPEATTKMVRSGLRIVAAQEEFDAATAHLDDEKFALEFERLLAKVANDL